MPNPALALGVFALVCLVAALLFWPGRGAVPRLREMMRSSERIHLEDALKHLLKEEWAGREGTVESVAGALEMPRRHVVDLLGRLEARGLARGTPAGFALTEEGRRYALRIVRSHRLFERYLAERTGLDPSEWHTRAERAEHELDDAGVRDLAARLGNPLVDPHGDPIPTPGGEMPPRTGTPLSSLRPGETGVVTHLEDEPATVFRGLLDRGLSPGMRIQRLESDPGTVRFRAAGSEHLLDAGHARNVTVRVRPGLEVADAKAPTLADLPAGKVALVEGIAGACQGPQRRRLLDLGLVPGTRVGAEYRSAGGDPTAYRIRGALIALRRSQAEQVRIGEVLDPAGEEGPVEVDAAEEGSGTGVAAGRGDRVPAGSVSAPGEHAGPGSHP